MLGNPKTTPPHCTVATKRPLAKASRRVARAEAAASVLQPRCLSESTVSVAYSPFLLKDIMVNIQWIDNQEITKNMYRTVYRDVGVSENVPGPGQSVNFVCNPHTSNTAQGSGGRIKNRKPRGQVGCCESRMADRTHWWTERWLELCFLEWLQWLQWSCGRSPHPQLLDVVWCSVL